MTATLIVPAFNEARTVAGVLAAATAACVFESVVCVDDGSTDATAAKAGAVSSVTVIRQPNKGKALALKTGLAYVSTPVVAFLDADLTGFTSEHIRALVLPVLEGRAAATIGIFKSGRGATDFAQRVAPMISGQRCMFIALLADFAYWEDAGFGIEHALNDHLKRKGVSMLEVPLSGASHLMKEEKHGLLPGFARRLKMYWEIARYNLTKSRRK